jgi:predicted RNA-binding Zn-ribbon protein involved in translation (DUF1610 family)
VAVESKLAGVTLYAPAPKVEAGPEAKTFKCPQCGATTAYDPAAASVTCASCGFVQPLQAQVVGRAAAVSEFTVDTLAREARGWGRERRELHCDACGANLSLAPADLSATCPFCGSNRVVARAASEEALRPTFVIPFKIQPDRCSPLARDWLGRGWMHPAGLSAAAGSARFTGVYLPFWTFSARVIADWRAEVGYERTRRVYDAGSKEWRTETVIEWRWENSRVVVSVADQLEPGTTKVSAVLLRRVAAFDLNDLAAYDPGFLAGWQAQAYDVALPAAWDTARTAMRERAKDACRADISSAHVRNLTVAAAFEDEVWRYVLLPVYVAPYRFEGQLYQLMINGQTGHVVGQKPVAWAKVWLVVAALLSPGALLALLGLPLTLVAGLGTILLVAGGVLFLAGLVVSGIILWQAMQSGSA